jgi:hypothetical protein
MPPKKILRFASPARSPARSRSRSSRSSRTPSPMLYSSRSRSRSRSRSPSFSFAFLDAPLRRSIKSSGKTCINMPAKSVIQFTSRLGLPSTGLSQRQLCRQLSDFDRGAPLGLPCYDLPLKRVKAIAKHHGIKLTGNTKTQLCRKINRVHAI